MFNTCRSYQYILRDFQITERVGSSVLHSKYNGCQVGGLSDAVLTGGGGGSGGGSEGSGVLRTIIPKSLVVLGNSCNLLLPLGKLHKCA